MIHTNCLGVAYRRRPSITGEGQQGCACSRASNISSYPPLAGLGQGQPHLSHMYTGAPPLPQEVPARVAALHPPPAPRRRPMARGRAHLHQVGPGSGVMERLWVTSLPTGLCPRLVPLVKSRQSMMVAGPLLTVTHMITQASCAPWTLMSDLRVVSWQFDLPCVDPSVGAPGPDRAGAHVDEPLERGDLRHHHRHLHHLLLPVAGEVTLPDDLRRDIEC
jgi:hypothetical protein